jgi:protein SCO1
LVNPLQEYVMNLKLPPRRLFSIALLLLAAGLLAARWLGDETPAAPVVRIGGPFSLIDQKGQPRTEKDLLGRPSLIYFGYSFCPDVCPTDLAAMSAGLEAFEARHPALGRSIQPVFISVDPQRDTPQALGAFATAFHPRLLALTGTPAQAAAVRKAWHVHAARAAGPAGDADYLVDHQAFIFLMDARGGYVSHIGQAPKPEIIAAWLEKLLA